MKAYIYAGLLSLIATAALAGTPTYNADMVKAACSAEWGTEYEMVSFCIDENRAGYNEFVLILEAQGASLSKSFAACQREWKHQWNMVTFCANENIEAAQELEGGISDLPPQIVTEIKSDCAREWGTEIPMVAFCVSERADGWRSINN